MLEVRKRRDVEEGVYRSRCSAGLPALPILIRFDQEEDIVGQIPQLHKDKN